MVQYARTDVRKYSFAVRVVDRWIQLTESVRMTQGKEANKTVREEEDKVSASEEVTK